MAKRKSRSDSNTTEGEMLRDRPPEPPAHVYLRECDLPYWASIVRAREFGAWNETDLEQAANLARCKADIDRLSREIQAEGDVIENPRGTPIVNPKHNLLETLSRRSVALSRMLHVHAEATEGESRHQAKRNAKQRDAANTADSLDGDDGLIARPVH